MGFFTKTLEKEFEEKQKIAAQASKFRQMTENQLIMAAILEHDAGGDQVIDGALKEVLVSRCGYDPYE